MRIAFISDAHLFQNYIENYNPIQDFEKVLNEIKQKSPDLLLMAGDMFDYKKNIATYLRHYEGEGLMIKVRDILGKFKIPIYAIRGNHEKEEVLHGLKQTVENFHYIKNDWVNFKVVSIFFMDAHFEGELYEPNVISQIFEQSLSSIRMTTPKTILLTHETLAPFENSLPKEVIEKASKVFTWIVNGHMHTWNPNAYGLKNVITLPSLLPSRVILGKYWMEKYVWESTSEKPKLITQESPFGYVILDVSNEEIKFHRFIPSRKIIEISIDVTGLSLKDVLNRFRIVLDEISLKERKDSIIVLPEIHGTANFITTFVGEIFKEYTDLNIETLRNNTTPKIITPSGKVIPPPILSVEQIFSELEKEITKSVDELSRKANIELNPTILKNILKGVYESKLLENPPEKIVTQLEILIDEILSKILTIRKPEIFEDHAKELIKKVKER